MNIFKILVILFVFQGCISATNENKKTPENQARSAVKQQKILDEDSTETKVLNKVAGDFNGDGTPDSAFTRSPGHINKDSFTCGECVTTVQFTHGITNIPLPGRSIGALLFNVGDLNQDKADELLVIPTWFVSCVGPQYVYSFKGQRWDTVAQGTVYRCLEKNTIRKTGTGTFEMKEYLDGEEMIRIVRIKNAR